MRDFLLNETLRRLSTEAATRFNAMVAEGEQIPFDVATDTAEDSPFYSYVPQTGRYVAERTGELHALPSWNAAREAVVEAGVASTYLEARGEVVPAEPGARAERMLEVFFVETVGRAAAASRSTANGSRSRSRRSTRKRAAPTTPTS